MILQLAFCQRLETKGINAYYPCCWTRNKTYMERIEVVDSPKSSKTGKQHNHSQISTVGNWKSCFLPHHLVISKHSLGDFPFPTVEFFFWAGSSSRRLCVHSFGFETPEPVEPKAFEGWRCCVAPCCQDKTSKPSAQAFCFPKFQSPFCSNSGHSHSLLSFPTRAGHFKCPACPAWKHQLRIHW